MFYPLGFEGISCNSAPYADFGTKKKMHYAQFQSDGFVYLQIANTNFVLAALEIGIEICSGFYH